MVEKFAGVGLEETIIMGVVNLSQETFYGKSLAESAEEAADTAERMVENGAQIIDLGSMSTGPEVDPISLEEEKRKLIPAVETVRERVDVPISVDTQRSEAAREALDAGAEIINDVSGFKADSEMAEIVGVKDSWAVLMANQISGRIRTAEKNRGDIKSMSDIREGIEESLEICRENGVDLEKVSIDPAIGFGRGKDWDLKVLAKIEGLLDFDLPICIGVSRKSFIGKVLDLDDPSERLFGSLGATAVAVIKGADIIRTHDPLETTQLIRIIEAILEMEKNEGNDKY